MPTADADALIRRIQVAAEALGRKVRLMEVCGTHTHAIGRGGLRSLMPDSVELVSGPGCPVCVTSQRDVERMVSLCAVPSATLCTFGDMIRVTGLDSSLEQRRSQGADVRVVYSALDALQVAGQHPERDVIFLGVGFETTTPGIAAAILQAQQHGLANFSVYGSHKTILPAMRAVLEGECLVDAFITPGHVTAILGAEAYRDLAQEFSVPCVATGFEPVDVLSGVALLLECLLERRYESLVQYARAVKPGGNARAREVMHTVFEPADAEWRGLGVIPGSGLDIRPAFAAFDAARRFSIPEPAATPTACRCGDVLKGLIAPPACPFFRTRCTPRTPLGPCMVSSEGACAARYKYG